jgi:hypothetical protein
MDAKRALEPVLSSIAYELGDPKARDVRNVLDSRRELRQLTDHFDYALSGQMSLQEKFSLYLQEGAVFGKIAQKFEKKGKLGRVVKGIKGMYSESERAFMLRRTVANAFEDAWKWLGFSELRPTTMFSQARLRMEHGDLDPVTLMAERVSQERREIEEEVTERVEAQQEATGEAAVAEAEEAPKGVVLGRVPTEEVQVSTSRVQELIDQGKSKEEAQRIAATEAAGEGPEAEEEGEEPPAEWEEQAAREEAALSEEERLALDEAERLDAHEIAERLRELAKRVESSDLSTQNKALLELVGYWLGRVSREQVRSSQDTSAAVKSDTGRKGKGAAGEQTAKPETGTAKRPAEAKKPKEQPRDEARNWRKFLESQTAREFLRRVRKTPEELAVALDGLATGEKGLKDFAEEFVSKGEKDTIRASKMRKVFYDLLKGELSKRGFKEGEIEDVELANLQIAVNRAAEAAMDKDWSDSRKREFKKYFWMTALSNTWEELKTSVAKGLREGQ